MQSRLAEDHDGVGTWGDVDREFQQVKGHGGLVALGQDETCTNLSRGTNGAEEIGRACAGQLRDDYDAGCLRDLAKCSRNPLCESSSF